MIYRWHSGVWKTKSVVHPQEAEPEVLPEA